MNCLSCQYYKALTFFKLGSICLNHNNKVDNGIFLSIPNNEYTCNYFQEYVDEFPFEWDEKKNKTNLSKHGIDFNRIVDLYKDDFLLQRAETPDKWEDLSKTPDHVDKNEGNMDPVRAKLIGNIDGKIYTAVYTFRHGIEKMKYRIISLRRADKYEKELYEEQQIEKIESQ